MAEEDLLDTSPEFYTIPLKQHLEKLHQQIEVASRVDNLNFLHEIAIEHFTNKITFLKNKRRCMIASYRNNLCELLSFLIYLFETNFYTSHSWLIHSTLCKFVFLLEDDKSNDLINDDLKKKLQLYMDPNNVNLALICSSKLLPQLQNEEVVGYYKKLQCSTISEKDEFSQSLLIKLRNALYQNPIYTSVVIDMLSHTYSRLREDNLDYGHLNLFNKIYLQAMIHSLKNQNPQLMLSILILSPDCIFTDQNLVCQFIDGLVSSSKSENHDLRLLSLYSSALFRRNSSLIRSVSTARRSNLKFCFDFLKSNQFFDIKECFLLAVNENKHFLKEFLNFYYNNSATEIGNLPLKSQIVLILLSLYHLVSRKEDIVNFEDILSHFESNLSDLLLKYEFEDLDNNDQIFSQIVEKLKFVFKFAEWCHKHVNYNNQDKYAFYYGIVTLLLTGSSPLKILCNHGFFELKIRNISFATFQEKVICDYVCNLVDQYDRGESMILKGFIVIRLVLFCIFSKENENVYFDANQLQSLIQNIYPISFRLEVMENLFSLLFLTKNDVNRDISLNSSEEEDYLDETLSSVKASSQASDARNRKRWDSDFANFICPNWLIPKLLEVLKDMLYKTNSDFFTLAYNEENSDQELSESVIGGYKEELKSRMATLLKYVNDAQFRLDVIRPAFYKNIAHTAGKENEVEAEAEFSDELIHSEGHGPKATRCISTTASSDTDYQQCHLSTSLVSCMLASHTQLLCYTLIETRIDNSRKIAHLFEEDLKHSKEYKELQLLDYFCEFHSKISAVQEQFSDTSSLGRLLSIEEQPSGNLGKMKIGDITSLGIRSSRIQSLLYEMLLKMEKVDSDSKSYFMFDYGLASAPSLEIAQAILESILTQNSHLLLQSNHKQKKTMSDRMEFFMLEVQKMISHLSQFIDISQISMAEYLEKSLTFTSLLDSPALIDVLRTELQLCQAYYEFDTLLSHLERWIIEDPNIAADQQSSQDNAKQLTKAFDSLMQNCPIGKYQYLKALHLYVRKVSKALVECRKRNQQTQKNIIDSSIICSSSYFSILKQSPSAILCSMVIKSKISPKIIDDLALIMKVNLIEVLCSVYCPTIPSSLISDYHIDFLVAEMCQPSLTDLIQTYFKGVEQCRIKLDSNVMLTDYFAEEATELASVADNSFQPLINKDVLNYFHSKCSVLVEILCLLGLIDQTQISDISSISTTHFQIESDSSLTRWVNLIRSNFFYGDLSSTLSLAFYPRIPSGHSAVIKTLEHYALHQNYVQIYNLFKYIEDFSSSHMNSFLSHSEEMTNSFKILQNAIYSRLAFTKDDARYVFQIIRDPIMKAKLILGLIDTFEKYDETFCSTRLIRLGLQSIRDDELAYEIDASEWVSQLKSTLKEIEFYASVGQLTGLRTWKDAKNNLSSFDVLTIIKTKKRYKLAIDWYQIHGLEADTCDLHMELLIYAYSELNDYVFLRKLFQMFVEEMKTSNVIVIVERTLNQVENLELRGFLVEFLIQYHRKRLNLVEVDNYDRYKLGIEIVKLLSRKIREYYIELISEPLLLMEQLLMNGEIESLEKIVNKYRLFKSDELVEKYAQKSVYIELYDSSSFSGSDTTMISSNQTDSNKSFSMFVVPDKIPSKDQWVSDTSETHCMLCQIVRFSMINRRHHCRRCGRVVCNTCSSNNLVIPEINSNAAVRVCDDCHLWHLRHKKTRKESSHLAPNNSKRTQWQLSIVDDVANQSRRSEFFYESSPSVTLCLAILRLHSNKKRSCKFIIDRICAPLLESTTSRNVDSTLLIEMIRSLLISTRISFEEDINQLDDHEKKNESSQEIEQLNLYLDRLDVIRMMINANCGTKEMIGYVLSNNIQKLQEKLVEAERFELAIDIAKKYGLDSISIWKTSALICLKHFQFVEARRKFTRCFDQMTRFSEMQQTLHMIVDTLVSNSLNTQSISVKDKCAQIIARNYDLLLDQTDHVTAPTSFIENVRPAYSQHLKPRTFQEVVYYLETYGSNEDLLRFYVNHSYWKEAVDYFIVGNGRNLSISGVSSSFLQDVFLPAQTNGCLRQLLASIRQSDPQLNSLWSCLISICKYLDKNSYHHSLYRVQVFMNDYLRAAITQINCFFLATQLEPELNSRVVQLDSFDLLHRRIAHLEKARDHCNMYLHNIEYVKVKPGCLVVEKKDVFQQIRLIELQIDILKRFKLKRVVYPVTVSVQSKEELVRRLLTGHPTRPDSPNSLTTEWLPLVAFVLHMLHSEPSIKMSLSLYPPTLLENDLQRKSLITAMIILHFCDSIEEGFRFSIRIIQEHNLDAPVVYRIAASLLLARHLETNQSVDQVSSDLKQLLTCIRSSHSSLDVCEDGEHTEQLPNSMVQLADDIVAHCIHVVETFIGVVHNLSGPQQNQLAYATGLSRAKLSEVSESLVRLIVDESRRIEAYLHAGKLKLAYLLAVSLGQRAIVVRVLQAAQEANDHHYIKICEMWLKKNVN